MSIFKIDTLFMHGTHYTMDLDFHELYKDYTTLESLKIVKRPEDYQPGAIDAAARLLDSREISAADEESVSAYYKLLAEQEMAEQENSKIRSYREKATDLLEPILQPGPEVKPAKWLNILLLFIAAQYCWTLFVSIRDVILTILDSRRHFFFTYLFGFGLFHLIYVPVIFYLLYKKRRWGWILLFADNIFCVISLVGQVVVFFVVRPIFHQNGWPVATIAQLALRSYFVFFLWKQDIAVFFGITPKAKTETVAIAGSLLLIVIAGNWR